MAALHTRSANRKALASGAVSKLSRTGTSVPAPERKVRAPERKSLGISKPIFRGGALGGTRTPTMLLTATSRQRVYQFRHER